MDNIVLKDFCLFSSQNFLRKLIHYSFYPREQIPIVLANQSTVFVRLFYQKLLHKFHLLYFLKRYQKMIFINRSPNWKPLLITLNVPTFNRFLKIKTGVMSK